MDVLGDEHMSIYKLSKIEILFIIILLIGATLYIVSGAYDGINGRHTWRQADVYGHILGFMEYKNFLKYDKFILGQQAVYDIPIYQWIIAKLSILLHKSPFLITSLLNYIFWIITAFSGYIMAKSLGKQYAGLSFLFLFATSPLVLHYFSVPMSDTMSIAFSMIAITLLHQKGITYKSLLITLPFMAIATLIKSPIPYVFLVFYLNYVFFRHVINNSNTIITFLKKNIPLVVFLTVIVIFVVLAEFLRKQLLSGFDGLAFAQDPKWYFGTLDLRMSKEFWLKIQARLYSADPIFSFICIFITLRALVVKGDKNLYIVTFSSLISFFSGWFTFSNVYFLHDYYELPIMIIFFISSAVSISYLIEFEGSRYLEKFNFSKKTLTLCFLFLIIFYLILTKRTIFNRDWDSFYSVAECKMKNIDVFLYVKDDFNGDPTVGGRLNTKFKVITTKEFEGNCLVHLEQYQAVLVDGKSQCLNQYKTNYESFFQDQKFTLFIKDSEQVPYKSQLKNGLNR